MTNRAAKLFDILWPGLDMGRQKIMANQSLTEYYANRALEYDNIYNKPETIKKAIPIKTENWKTVTLTKY